MGTFVYLGKAVLSSNQTSITLTGFSTAYDDLRIIGALKTTTAGAGFEGLNIALKDASNTTTYSSRGYQILYSQDLSGNFAPSYVDETSGVGSVTDGPITSVAGNANRFGDLEMYISDYYSTTRNKVVLYNSAHHNDSTATTAAANFGGRYVLNTSAQIGTIVITSRNGQTFQSGSGFWIYGIKASAVD